LVATRNESPVISRLLKSFSKQIYPKDNFEIIIVDDSTDDTFDKILKFSGSLPNLKATHRISREGWKGGALNTAVELMSPQSSFAMVVDADAVLLNDTLEAFISEFATLSPDVVALQGFPVSKAWPDTTSIERNNCKKEILRNINEYGNWVARAIDFRLAQRNMVEFSAKQKLDLPIQITGSLFMIRSDVLIETRFRSDLCEDWDLTLDLYLQNNAIGTVPPSSSDNCLPRDNSDLKNNNITIVFDPYLQCCCEATTKLRSYFRQRMRVSEGHTRAFRKRIMLILQNKNLSLQDKFEIISMGLQYAKFIAIPIVGILDIIMATLAIGMDLSLFNSAAVISSMLIQAASFCLAILCIIVGGRICRSLRRYGFKDIIGLLALIVSTMPAIIIGSFRGFVRDNGVFYRTQRNILRALPDSAA
jgi:cellulose synthase/poly-beta-1,6-N-acetylglucosamine synthase-like glycosyltransferase